MTKAEFYQQINDLPNQFQNRALETYLSALLLLVQERKGTEITAEQLLDMLKVAFSAPPIEFENEWLNLTEPPVVDLPHNTGYDFSVNVIRFQIAELRKMHGKQLNSDMKYFGVISATDNPWYNFDPYTNLECGTCGLLNDPEDDQSEFIADWQALGELLEIGRVYE